MQTRIACHALAVMKPHRTLVCLITFYIAYRTQACTFPTTYALPLIYGEMLVGNEVIMEEAAKESAIQAWECAFVKMLSGTALADPFREFLNLHGSIANLFLLT